MTYKYLNENMTLTQLKQERNKLAKILHPDAGGDNADIQQLNAEYEILKLLLKDKTDDPTEIWQMHLNDYFGEIGLTVTNVYGEPWISVPKTVDAPTLIKVSREWEGALGVPFAKVFFDRERKTGELYPIYTCEGITYINVEENMCTRSYLDYMFRQKRWYKARISDSKATYGYVVKWSPLYKDIVDYVKSPEAQSVLDGYRR